jgi:putative oxidoreductase
MRIGPKRIVQAVFGGILIAFSLTPLFGWEPPPVQPGAQLMQEALLSSGYIIPIILIVYFLVGISWIANRFVPLSAVVLFPISLNILLFHWVLNRTAFSLVAATLLFAVNLYMLYQSRRAYSSLLKTYG